MSQSFSELINGVTIFPDLYDIINQNIATVRSQFSGTTQPNNPSIGQPYFNSDTGVWYVWDGALWKEGADVSPKILALTAEMVAARGSASSLSSRLAVAINDDGTLKGDAPTGSWWMPDSNNVSKSTTYIFISNGDARALYNIDRAVKMVGTSLTTYDYVKEISYDSGLNTTAITLYGANVPDGLTAVDVGQPLYNSPRVYIYQLGEVLMSGPTSGNETDDVNITITNYVAEQDYIVEVTGGSTSRVGNTITWTLPTVTVDTQHTLTVYTVRTGFIRSVDATYDITVVEVPITDGPTIIYADTADDWPDATIAGGFIDIPAYSLGTTNTNQFYSATPEITTNATAIPVGVGTTATSLVTTVEVVEGDKIITDQGDSFVGTVSYVDPNYTATVDLTGIPTKAFTDPSVSKLNVDVTSTSTSLVSSDILTEGETVILGGVGVPIETDLGAVTTSPSGGVTDILPTMVAETTDGFTITDSGGNAGAAFAPWRMADGVASRWAGLVSGLPQTVLFELPSSKAVIKYKMGGYGSGGPTEAPKSWVFEGQNDDLSWDTLDTQSNQTDWLLDEVREYPIASPATYINYRLVISEYNGGTYVAIETFNMEEAVISYTSDITAAGLSTAPLYASRKPDAFSIGYGITGEHIGPQIDLAVDAATTTSTIVTTSTESQATNIFITDGIHNSLLCDGVLATVASVSEEDSPLSIPGTRVAGGIAVGPYTFADGFEGFLVVVPASQRVQLKHGLFGTDVTELDNVADAGTPDTHTGLYNTSILTSAAYNSINDGQGSVGAPAADYCTDLIFEGCSDFFLMSKEEHNLVYQNKALVDAADDTSGTNLAAMGSYWSWTSSEYNSKAAWGLRFSDGSPNTIYEYGVEWVLPARRIPISGYATTSTLVTPLSVIPTTVAIPNRYTETPASNTTAISGTVVKVTGAEVVFPENPDIKQVALSVIEPTTMKFNTGTLYTKEKL